MSKKFMHPLILALLLCVLCFSITAMALTNRNLADGPPSEEGAWEERVPGGPTEEPVTTEETPTLMVLLLNLSIPQYDRQPADLAEVQALIDAYETEYLAALERDDFDAAFGAYKPCWQYPVAEDLMPRGWCCDFVNWDEEFGAEYYTFFPVPVAMAATWNNAAVEPGTTIIIASDGTFDYGGSTYEFDADSIVSVTDPGNLTIELNNADPVTIKELSVAKGDLTIRGTGMLNVENPSGNAITMVNDVSVVGQITITDATVNAIADSYGIFAWKNIEVNNGILSGSSKSSDGINTQQSIIVNGGEVHGITEGEDRIGVRAWEITVNGGSLTGESTGMNGIGVGTASTGTCSITVENSGKLKGTADGGGSIGVSATAIDVHNSGSILEGWGGQTGVSVHSRMNKSAAIGSIDVSDGGVLTGEGGEYGVYNSDISSPKIFAQSGGSITGTAPHYGVYADYGTIEAIDGSSVVKGIADAASRLNNGDDTSAVMIAGNPIGISAANGGVIWEDYPYIQLAFDNTTPKDPYANGVNIASIANYSWDHDLAVATSGIGLLAQTRYDGVQTITGTRMGDVTGEKVNLDDNPSTHKITFSGIFPEPTYRVTYNANGGSGGPHTVSDISDGGTHTVLTRTDTGISRAGYTFNGWNTAANGRGTSYQAGNIISVTDNVTLFAQWSGSGGYDGENEKDPDPEVVEPEEETKQPEDEPEVPEDSGEPEEEQDDPLPPTPERPAPTSGDRELVPDEDGYLELDENGTPLGRWSYDPITETWIFDPYVPLGTLPQTGGGAGFLLLMALGLALIALGFVLDLAPRRNRG